MTRQARSLGVAVRAAALAEVAGKAMRGRTARPATLAPSPLSRARCASHGAGDERAGGGPDRMRARGGWSVAGVFEQNDGFAHGRSTTMNLHEYQAKDLFRSYGVPVPPGRVAGSADEAAAAAPERWGAGAGAEGGGG